MTITHRERALAALNHIESDRVPLDLGASRNSGIHYDAYESLVRHLGYEDDPLSRDDFGLSKVVGIAKPSENVLQRLGVDFRGIFLGKADQSLEKILPNGDWQDELGIIRRRPEGSYYWDVIVSPFAHDFNISDIKTWDWPDPNDQGYTRGIQEKAINFRKETDYAVVMHLHDIVVHQTQFLLGFERWFTSFILEPSLISALLDAVLDIRMGVAEQALDLVGEYIDVVSCSDDLADARGPMISLDMYRRFIKPRHRRYLDLLRRKTSAKILYHSCGAVSKLIPEFIGLGIDFLNPVQVSAMDMDTAVLKKEYGNQIGFWGGIDTTHVLPHGNLEDVRLEVKKRIEDLASGGGYILAAVHNIQPDVPPENIVAFFDYAQEYRIKYV